MDGRTDRILMARLRLHSTERGKIEPKVVVSECTVCYRVVA